MIRGGISMIHKSYTEAKNNFLKTYDANEPTSYIIHSDANNFYGDSKMQLVSTEYLIWLIQKILI